MSDNNLQKAGIGMELTKQERKSRRNGKRREKRQKAETRRLWTGEEEKLSRGAYLARWQESLCCSS